MDIADELTVFPTAVHRLIYSCGRALTPVSVATEGMEDRALAGSCRELHDFFAALYADMYEAPSAYGLDAGALERFLDGRRLNGVKQKQPARTERLLALTRNSAQGYQMLMCLLGQAGEADGARLGLPAGALEQAERRIRTAVRPQSLEERLRALERVGLVRCEGGLESLRFPGMFAALCALARTVGDRLSGFGYFNFCNAEFRALRPGFKPSPEDYFRPLAAERRALAQELDGAARALGCRPTINTFWKVDYKYRGLQVMCLESGEGELTVRLTETYAWDDPELINGRLLREEPDVQRAALKRLWRCDACSTSHLGQFVTVLGRRQRVCGGGVIGFRWLNPGESDRALIEKLMGMRIGIADELKPRAR